MHFVIYSNHLYCISTRFYNTNLQFEFYPMLIKYNYLIQSPLAGYLIYVLLYFSPQRILLFWICRRKTNRKRNRTEHVSAAAGIFSLAFLARIGVLPFSCWLLLLTVRHNALKQKLYMYSPFRKVFRKVVQIWDSPNQPEGKRIVWKSLNKLINVYWPCYFVMRKK
jgi:hypothetical protein